MVAHTPDESQKAAESEAVRKFLETAKDRWKLADEAESRNRKDSLDDWDFRIGNQWPADIQTVRVADGRPCHTINRLPQFTRQVTNEQRQNRPAILVSPVGDKSDPDTAKFLQGVVRHIEVASDADVAYDTAFEHCVMGGFGYCRLVTEYVDSRYLGEDLKNAWDQEIFIRRIKNPFAVYFDPSCVEADYSDARFAFVIEDLTAEEYKRQYPKSEVASLGLFTSTGNNPPGWLTKESCRIAEYFYVEEKKRRLLKLEDGFIIEEEAYKRLKADDPLKPPVAAFRDVLDRRVKWSRINAVECLEGGPGNEVEWPGNWIPIIPWLGDDLDVNGKRYLAGLIRHAKDPQRMYNYWNSAATETIALAPKAPFIAAEGQIEGHESEWQQANVRNFAVLQYKPQSVAGQAAPPPQRNTVEPPIQAMALMIRQADNDLKATMGIYDASLGERGPEQSGKAILARQRQGSIATLNFSDNANRSIRFLGKQIIDLVPKIYDAPRILKIVRPDETVEQAAIFNSTTTDMSKDEAMKALGSPALMKIYDVGVGAYDVTISSGPSYQSKRQEAVESMTALVQAYPNLMALVGDLLIMQMDWPFAQEIATRLKKSLPPDLQDQGDEGDPKTQVMKLQQQLKGLMDQHAALTKELTAAAETIQTKKLELESKERINALQVQSQLLIAEAKIRGEASLSLLTAMIADIQNRLALLNEGKTVVEEQAPTPQAPPPATPVPASPATGGVQ
jgi:hypothetical protein